MKQSSCISCVIESATLELIQNRAERLFFLPKIITSYTLKLLPRVVLPRTLLCLVKRVSNLVQQKSWICACPGELADFELWDEPLL